jgi:tRNA threonylcarbamoyladenosine biosynthesis protein TsaE
MTGNRPVHISDAASATVDLGRQLAAHLKPGDVIALIGELGAGKTQLTRGVVEGLGGDGRAVSSPTFVLMQEYETTPPVVHIDAYRLSDIDEVRDLGWSDDVIDTSVTLIEWADRIAAHLPDDCITIELEHMDETTRRIQISGLQVAASTPCPICQKLVQPDAQTYPFCSKRCKQADLGRWFGGDYKVSREIKWDEDDLDELTS